MSALEQAKKDFAACIELGLQQTAEHLCYESDNYYCDDGVIYGYCGSEMCYGACEKHETCQCPRHDDATKECSAQSKD